MFHHSYIAVHGGAGMHGHTHEREIKQALRLACRKSLQYLHTGRSAAERQPDTRNDAHLNMVEDAISILEDDPHLNAGYGSNLALNGTVECDAAIMEGGSNDFGSVGAVSGVKNPIRLARLVLEYSRIPDILGRIPPLTLVSEGAHAFANSHSETVQTVSPETLVSPEACDQWKRWKDRLESSATIDEVDQDNLRGVQDTVGAVAWHHVGGMAAGVSSGGLLLKYPGRIGEASVFGAGCWAQQSVKVRVGMACSISGAGEHIVRATLARAIGDAFNVYVSRGLDVDPHDILRRVLLESFWRPCQDRGDLNPDAGVLLLTTEEDGEGTLVGRLWCAFTTSSMAIAYASSKNPKPKALILRRPEGAKQHPEELQIYITAISL